jgi:hypothetical protein
MRARIVLLLVAVVVLSAGAPAQQQPVRVNPAPTQPASPTTPSRPTATQPQVVTSPVRPVPTTATPLTAGQIRAVAVQSQPPAGTTREEQAELRVIADLAKKGDFGGMNEKWIRSVDGAAKRDKKYQEWIELESWNSYVLHQAYIAPNPDLSGAADKVRFYSAQESAAQAHRAELTRAKASLAQPTTQTVSVQRLNLSSNYEPKRDGVSVSGTEQVSKDTIDAELREIEEKLNTIGDDAQLANVDLQNKLQQQQQTLQMMSNVSKMLHDTAMATIRKIGS